MRVAVLPALSGVLAACSSPLRVTTELDLMRVVRIGAIFVAVFAFAALAGCAANPAKPGEAATASNGTASAPVAASPSTAPSTATSTKKIPSGYRRVTRGGKELYCRSVVTLGSRFPEQMCFTREQLDDIASRTEKTMNDIDRSTSVCTGVGQCGGT
jgi:hypothetical protein